MVRMESNRVLMAYLVAIALALVIVILTWPSTARAALLLKMPSAIGSASSTQAIIRFKK